MLVEPPNNGEYLVAAYAVTAVIVAGYWLRLRWKAKQLFSAVAASRAKGESLG